MKTNHPANGPVSLDRLRQISEILSKAAAQSDGGNLGYAMADAVKVIDGAISAFGAEPVVQDECTIFDAAIDKCRTSEAIDEHAWNHGVLVVMTKFNECRSAMLQAGNSPAAPDCSCRTCRPITFTDSRFVVCPECGNKRCPHANDHRNDCTGSNEPGQVGSAYPASPNQ